MSQSSVKEQVEELKAAGLPKGMFVGKGTRIVAREPDPNEDLRRFGSDLWHSRWCHNVFENYPLIKQCAGARWLHEACKGMTAFVVGIGPSLDDQIDDLRQAKGRGVIIATDAALRALLAKGITPDLVVSLDCKPEQKLLWENLPPGVSVPALLNSCTHKNTIESWPGPILFFNQWHTQDELCERILPDVLPELGQLPSGGTVGNMALFAAHLMGCDQICAVGMDFCYSKDKKYRATDYKYESERGFGVEGAWLPTVISELYDNDDRLQTSFIAKGEDGKEFLTDRELTFYLEGFKDIMAGFKLPIVNCSPDGMIPSGATWKMPDGSEVIHAYEKMSVKDAVGRFCPKPYQGGRSVLAHLSKIVPDPRKT